MFTVNPGAQVQFGGPAHRDVATISITDLIDNSIFRCHALPRISYGKNVNWTPHDIQGRSLPIYGYQSSSSTSFNLTIPIHGSIERGDKRNIQHVKEACDWFHSLMYPDYGVGGAATGTAVALLKPPHKLLLSIANFKTMICIPNSVSFQPGEVWDTLTGLPFDVEVTLALSEIGISALGVGLPPGVADIRPAIPLGSNPVEPPPYVGGGH
jgi:hypothetical protein